MSDTQYGMVIDLRGCVGCQTCVISCKTANAVPGEGYWSHVLSFSSEDGPLYRPTDGPDVAMQFRPTLCNHCEKPLCVANCPTGAIHKDEQTGIVAVDKDICIGCDSCEKACPYDIPMLDAEQKTVSKCNFCAGRLESGARPYCVESCPARIRHFGLVSDPESEVSKLIAENDAQQYLPDKGTDPHVYYILPDTEAATE